MVQTDLTEDSSALKFSDETIEGVLAIRGYTSTNARISLIILTFIAGITYIILQWLRQGRIKDAIFVSMLIGATFFLLQGFLYFRKYVVSKGLDFCVFLLAKENSSGWKGPTAYKKLCQSVFHIRRLTIAGLIYGMVVGSAPFILGVWNNDIVLKVSLAIFLFTVNLVTGIAFYGLITFLFYAIKMGRMANVDLWQINNPSTDFFLGATRLLGVWTSIYVSICISSILFSELNINELLVIGYAFFSGLIIVLAIFVPPLPIVNKLRKAKASSLFEIDKQIHLSFYEENPPGQKTRKREVDYEKVKTLLELREKVEAISTWPFRVRSILTAVSVLFIAAIPVILQFALTELRP